MKKINTFTCFILLLIALPFCKKDSSNDDDNNNGGNNSPLFQITGTSPDVVFWGEELTITGTGFSTNPADYSFSYLSDAASCIDTFKTEILGLSSTQVKIKAPIAKLSSGNYCGPNSLAVIVKAGGKTDTTGYVKMLGWPRIIDVCYHYGGFSGNYFTPGDSAVLTLEGATGLGAGVNNYNKNVKLRIGNDDIPFTWENFTGCGNAGGAKITLDISKYAEQKCPGDAGWNNGWRLLNFTAYVPGTNRMVSKDILVYWQPTTRYYGFSGPLVVSKSGGLPIAQWTVNGRHMFYNKVRFTPLNCNGTPQEMTIYSGNGFYNTNTFDIPLSVLSAGCSYNVSLINRCGNVRGVGTIQIVP